MAKSLIAVCDQFIDYAFGKGKVRGLTSQLSKQYMRYQLDNVLYEMGYQSLYNVTLPLKYMDKMFMNRTSKPDFLTRKPTTYQHSSVDDDKFTL